MLNKTFVSMKFNNDIDNERKVGNGVRKIGNISLLFVNVYINDLIKSIASRNNGCMLGTDWMNVLCYVDDILLLASSPRVWWILIFLIQMSFISLSNVVNPPILSLNTK